MKLIQETRSYVLDDGRNATLRVIQPSESRDVWPGNPTIIREWKVLDKGKTIYRNCTREELDLLEIELGEIVSWIYAEHPSLGLVVTTL